MDALCSGRQGHNPVSESLIVPVARFRHVAIPQLRNGNILFIARCKGPGCPVDSESQRWVQSGGLASMGARTSRNACSPENTPRIKLCSGIMFTSRTSQSKGEAEASWEETGKCTGEVVAGYGAEHLYKDCGDNAGNHQLPAGARSNLQRLAVYEKSKSARGFWWGA